MKRNFYCRLLKGSFGALLSFLFFAGMGSGFAQCVPDPAYKIKPLPEMFVDNGKAGARKKEFSAPSYPYPLISKKGAISSVAPNGKFTSDYSQKSISNLLSDIIRPDAPGSLAYFALYSSCNGFSLPISEKQLIILYAPCYPGTEPGKYYFLAEGRDDPIEVDEKCGKKWRDDYINKVIPNLMQTINANDPDNLLDQGGYSDTKSIYFGKDSLIHAFTDEEDYQCHKHGITITGYRISFSSYTQTGNEQRSFKKRLHVQFDYLYSKGGKPTVVLLDKQPGYSQRKKLKELKEKELKKESIFSSNNGQLCPTYCK